jgi:hypothetical protein
MEHLCDPTEHLVTVVGRRRMRDGLRERYWIVCELCDLSLGPYDGWEAAWIELIREQPALIRPGVGSAAREAGGARARPDR